MAVLEILKYPDPRLKKIAKPVEKFDQALGRIVNDMIETMYANEGIGLAATQVDIALQIVVMDLSEEQDDPQVLINPIISAAEGEIGFEEGCLSIPEVSAEIVRPKNILVRALDRDFKPIEFEADELLSVCIQHEIDHLDGKLFIDYLSPLKRRRLMDKYAKQQKAQTP